MSPNFLLNLVHWTAVEHQVNPSFLRLCASNSHSQEKKKQNNTKTFIFRFVDSNLADIWGELNLMVEGEKSESLWSHKTHVLP